ncbi:hypothetical protein M0R45_009302 [Rubus argutus]|uniref:Secreted protein n=1 Tax=Rubus argutus TaxID=59490 RepID=A0AAW1Y4L5_RUBAR
MSWPAGLLATLWMVAETCGGGLGMKKRESAHGGRAGIEPVMIDSERTPPSREYGETPRAAARAWEAGGDWGHTQQRPQDSAVLGVSIVAELD